MSDGLDVRLANGEVAFGVGTVPKGNAAKAPFLSEGWAGCGGATGVVFENGLDPAALSWAKGDCEGVADAKGLLKLKASFCDSPFDEGADTPKGLEDVVTDEAPAGVDENGFWNVEDVAGVEFPNGLAATGVPKGEGDEPAKELAGLAGCPKGFPGASVATGCVAEFENGAAAMVSADNGTVFRSPLPGVFT